jgi:hypothetical protein
MKPGSIDFSSNTALLVACQPAFVKAWSLMIDMHWGTGDRTDRSLTAIGR